MPNANSTDAWVLIKVFASSLIFYPLLNTYMLNIILLDPKTEKRYALFEKFIKSENEG